MITLEDYLNETEFASTKIIEAIWNDFRKSEKLKDEIQKQSKIVQIEYDRSVAMQTYAEDPDDVMQGVARYWDNYFGADKEVYHKSKELETLTKLLAVREFSLNLLCGNLLEHAKKGLSIIYGNPKTWPDGKQIGSQGISKIILGARNQSIHIEEAIKDGKFRNPEIQLCFDTLAKEIDHSFTDYTVRDLSFEIIQLLNWDSFEKYKNDMLTVV